LKIIVIKEDKPIDQITFAGSTATIGRKSDCDISIKDPAVSGVHALIEKVGEKFVIKDNKSTNGIFMKGRKVQQHVLKHEDTITIGEHRLRFLIGDGTISKGAAGGGTVAPVAAPGEKLAQVAGHLKVVSGKGEGSSISLEEGLTTIGEPGIQVAAVSRRPQGHFIIHVDGGKDKERVPLVNGEPTGFKSRKLENGDKIEVAGIMMEYVGA
jgi:pSer/pThr/pTyr-binding forkhead associated (FHA) protein